MEKSNCRIFKWVFNVSCALGAIYMSSLQVRRYFQNEDNSSSATKEFNQTPLDLYPSFSYCFEDKHGGLYIEQNLSDLTSLTREEYQKVIMGEKEFYNNESDIKIPNFLDMDVGTVTVNEDSIFGVMDSYFLNHSKEESTALGGRFGSFKDSSIIYKSYQDPVKLCFTRKSVFEEGITSET